MANNSNEKTLRKVIIDTDCGVDDAQAILLALSKQYEESLEILGITCVSGNVHLDKVCVNVLKVLEACSRTDIPVFKGAHDPLLAHDLDATHFHGLDGLGDSKEIPQPDMSLLQKEHAINFLIRSVKENPGEITLLTLGPLTNVALACKMDPTFKKSLKEVYIMGGSLEARGNVSLCGEFNFHFDPESAYIVLNEFCCPLILVTLETCDKFPLRSDFISQYFGQSTKKGKFAKEVSSFGIRWINEHKQGEYAAYDALAAAVFLEPDLVLKSEKVFCTVEVHGEHTRGQSVFDWRGRSGKEKNVVIPIITDNEKFKSLLLKSLE